VRPRALALVDGEHYPPVTQQAIDHLSRDFDVVAAVFAGGGEKLAGALTLGDLPVVHGADAADALARAIDEHAPAVVLDVSDAPVLDARDRATLASVALARGVSYRGAGFAFEPPPRPRLTDVATVAIIGTGKRTGKTAISAAFARHAAARGRAPVIVAMGRGGPAEPKVVRGAEHTLDARELLALADAGEHAASDSYEDAVVARVTTVGARRAGAGFAGATMFDTVARAVEVAQGEGADIIVCEGSGTAIPPLETGATVLVAGAATPVDGWLAYRLLISDVVVVTMAEEPVLSTETLSDLGSQHSRFARGVAFVRTVFRPAPVADVAGRKTFFATTAPEAAGPALVRHLEQVHGAEVVGITHRLSDRPKLISDLARAEGTYEVLLTELKAAAVDVAARAALAQGADVVFADNEPVALDGDLAAVFDDVLARADAAAKERAR
jgi:cyclic 2,3-diphosphoglycerate synthetase